MPVQAAAVSDAVVDEGSPKFSPAKGTRKGKANLREPIQSADKGFGSSPDVAQKDGLSLHSMQSNAGAGTSPAAPPVAPTSSGKPGE